MKKIYFFTALLIILTSCSSDTDSVVEEPIVIEKPVVSEPIPEPVVPTDNTVHRTIAQFYPSQTKIDNYTFEGNKVLSRKNDETETIYIYEGNRIVKQEGIRKDQFGLKSKKNEYQFIYEDGKLKTRTILEWSAENADQQPSIMMRTTYTHTSDNLVAYIDYIINLDTKKEAKLGEGFLRYKDGNVIENEDIALYITSKGGDFVEDPSRSVKTIVTYEYDKKNNPAKNILGYDLFLGQINDYGQNNILKKTVKRVGSDDINIETRDYIYNDKGYPVKYKSVASDGYEYEIEYTY
ncbi:hypothetical protein [Flavobacterium hercynium]|uniref:DUF4595 domain-containing protein n=1 Tax=Flavobacterium hercynium TaxID=387094 RepID=A0A226GP10_9FLAO|nr:hypothetical protein [Flavobacterium hercynium]OXA83394.1 hypothetical protein B0A66_22345 [Flavobacterium hercynium]SMP31584.1 hypothetical protein SAMN06265346_11459 [Flavobacterium hercynium]